MVRWTLFLALLLGLVFNSAFHGPVLQKDPWAELEKGLELCDVEISTYESYCFISESEQGQIASAAGLPEIDSGGEPDCCWTAQGGYENGEVLLRVFGTNRTACSNLWRRIDEAAGCCGGTGTRAWAVEGYLEGSHNLAVLGENLVQVLGGRLQQLYRGPGMVQVLAYLPWAGEGFMLDHSPVNLDLELYEDTYRKKIKIRLGVPVLLSLSKG
ncbi:MAG: hypothetical protein GX881_04535 [Firmicutes bacterium]|nr:hypothetical protein [Bacillota bacterium]